MTRETIDYRPCAFMDHYDPNTVFARQSRGGNQPAIGQWNLAMCGRKDRRPYAMRNLWKSGMVGAPRSRDAN
jgi:hypothetical protein